MSVLVFGHRNPDTDSIMSSLSLTRLKNDLDERAGRKPGEYKACRLGDINKETEFVLNYFGLPLPELISDVRTRIRDIEYFMEAPLTPQSSIISAIRTMHEKSLRALAVVNRDNQVIGIVTLQDIAISLVTGDFYELDTSLSNLVDGLGAKPLFTSRDSFQGNILVLSYLYETIVSHDLITSDSIVIVGDRHDILELAIDRGAQLIVVTGDPHMPRPILDRAKENGVSIISTPLDTYMTSKQIAQCNFVSPLMKREHLVIFEEDDPLDIVADEIRSSTQPYFPIVDAGDRYLGMFSRNNLIRQQGKKVILVDHNEYSQSAEGLREANIIEMYDHHKLGDIKTSSPIHFRNLPVGSSNTIVYALYRENGMTPDEPTAGAMISGIISDTLMLTSPTTTDSDRAAVSELTAILGIDVEKYAKQLFRAGTSLHGMTVEEIFMKDCKTFEIAGRRIMVSQIFTLDIERILEIKDSLISLMRRIHLKDRASCILLVTDIVKNGSYLFFENSADPILDASFRMDIELGTFLDGIVSRKKQVIPMIMTGLSEGM